VFPGHGLLDQSMMPMAGAKERLEALIFRLPTSANEAVPLT
jgi:hypothetical protein